MRRVRFEMKPENADFLDTLGWVYYRKGIYLTAVTNLKAAVAKKPTAEFQYHLALTAYGKAGNQEKAQENLKAALQLDPKLAMPEQLVTRWISSPLMTPARRPDCPEPRLVADIFCERHFHYPARLRTAALINNPRKFFCTLLN